MQPEKEKVRRRAFPRTGTNAAQEFYRTYSEIERLFEWVTKMAARSDYVSTTALEAIHGVGLLDDTSDEENDRELERRKQNIEDHGMISELKKQRQILLEVLLVRHVENFLNYISRLLAEIFVAKPETLSTDQQVSLREVVSHRKLEDFIREEAERRVNKLTYKSFSELNIFFQKRFNTNIVDDELEVRIVEAIEFRNLSVHNRGVVNALYQRRTNNKSLAIGKKREIYLDEYTELGQALLEATIDLDKRMRTKIKLRGINFRIQNMKNSTVPQI